MEVGNQCNLYLPGVSSSSFPSLPAKSSRIPPPPNYTYKSKIMPLYFLCVIVDEVEVEVELEVTVVMVMAAVAVVVVVVL